MPVRRPALALLDRDGTINVKADEGEYVTSPAELRLLPGAAEAIRMLNEADVPVVVVTNQRGIARGLMTEEDLALVHLQLRELLAAGGARVDEILYCPHEKGTCACRKPGTLLLERARNRFGLTSLENAWMIGDSVSDVQAGRAAGARTLLIGPDPPLDGGTDETTGSLLDAVRYALDVEAGHERQRGNASVRVTPRREFRSGPRDRRRASRP